MGCQEGGKEKFIKIKSLRTGVLKTRRGQGEEGKSFKAWLAKTKRGGKYLIKRPSLKALKAWVAKKGGGKI